MFNPPDFKPSIIANNLSKFSPSFSAGFVQHLTQPLHNRLLQRVDLRGPFQRVRHDSSSTKAHHQRVSIARKRKVMAREIKYVYFLKEMIKLTDTPTASSWFFPVVQLSCGFLLTKTTYV